MVGTAANHFACNGRSYADHTHGDVLYACAWACHPRLVSFRSILYVYSTRPAFLARDSRIRVVSYHLVYSTVYYVVSPAGRKQIRKEQDRTPLLRRPPVHPPPPKTRPTR